MLKYRLRKREDNQSCCGLHRSPAPPLPLAQPDPLPAALQTVYDQTCSDRMHYYGTSRWHCMYFKSGGTILNEDRRGLFVPRSFLWLDIINKRRCS